MADYLVVSSRLKAFTPGEVVSDLDLMAAGIVAVKSLAIGAIVEIKQNQKLSKKYAKPIEETE
jgi:hypothetical protein